MRNSPETTGRRQQPRRGAGLAAERAAAERAAAEQAVSDVAAEAEAWLADELARLGMSVRRRSHAAPVP